MKEYILAAKVAVLVLLAVPQALVHTAQSQEIRQAEQKLEWQQRRASILQYRDSALQNQQARKVAPKELDEISPAQPSTLAAQLPTTFPPSAKLTVPFSAQAPHGNWDMPYQEACEEMSLIMLDYFLTGRSMTPEQADAEIVQMVDWQERSGFDVSITMEELAAVLENYYGGTYKPRLIYNVSPEDIKREIAAGNPVIAPTAGKKLNNPYFSGGGPWYHMLVITGYDHTNFITNDPGTWRGEDYQYTHEVLLDSIHDWVGVPEQIEDGGKVVMVVERSA